MSFNAVCPKCNMVHVLPDDRDGRETRCMRCATVFISDHDPAVQRMERPTSAPKARRPPARRRRRLRLARRVAVVSLAAVLLGAGAYAAYRFMPARPDRLSRETLGRISAGMTEAQVRKILGTPTDVQDGLEEESVPLSRLQQQPETRQAPVRKLRWEEGDRLIWVELRDEKVQTFGGQFGKAQAPADGQAAPDDPAGVK
jgi:hypothetical protein